MSIIVQNLPSSITLKQLQIMFGKAGSCSVDLSADKKEAVVFFSYIKDARKALELYDNCMIQGQKIKLVGLDFPKSTGHTKDRHTLNAEAIEMDENKNSDNFLKRKSKRPTVGNIAARKTAYQGPIRLENDDEYDYKIFRADGRIEYVVESKEDIEDEGSYEEND